MDDTQTARPAEEAPPREVAAVVLLRADGAALLQHRDDKPGLPRAGMWVPPGGHRDPGESPLDCARRELYEETGYRCDGLHWLDTFLDRVEGGFAPQRLHVFWGAYDGAQELRCLEGQALEFVPRSAAAAYPMPAFVVPVWDRAMGAFFHTPGPS
jgi:8-oxo-dGTP pyrophosphatase MutT (NUDIX family)